MLGPARTAILKSRPRIPSVALWLYDAFDGTGALDSHVPDISDHGGWTKGGQSGVTWTLNGDGSVSQTANPTGAIRHYHCYHIFDNEQPQVVAAYQSPASGNFKAGGLVRAVDGTSMIKGVVSQVGGVGKLQIISVTASIDTVVAETDITLAYNTLYIIEIECLGDTINLNANGTEVSWASAGFNRYEFNVGITESVAVSELHGRFLGISVRETTADALSTRIVYADCTSALSGDDQLGDAAHIDISGNSSQSIVTANGQNFARLRIAADGTSPQAGVRLSVNFNSTSQQPVPIDAMYPNNVPITVYLSCYYWLALARRISTGWPIVQSKQRQLVDGGPSTTISPLYTISLVTTASPDQMWIELKTNILLTGEYDSSSPPFTVAEQRYLFPTSQWVRLDWRYLRHPSNGRITVWVDNVLVWDFPGIKTMMTGADWDGVGNSARHTQMVSNYCLQAEQPPANGNVIDMHVRHYAFSYRRLPDNYPTVAPV